MTRNATSTHVLRRTLAGLGAAGGILVGGVGTLSATDAQAAGVAKGDYVIVTENPQVRVATASAPRKP